MKVFSKEDLMKLEENTKVLVNVLEENLWIVCIIEKKDNGILLKDSEIDVYLTDIQEDSQDFCKVYAYTEKDEKILVKSLAKEKIEKKEKEFEIMEYWTMSIDWKKKCVNINFNNLHKKIELSAKDVKSMMNSFELLKMKEEELL